MSKEEHKQGKALGVEWFVDFQEAMIQFDGCHRCAAHALMMCAIEFYTANEVNNFKQSKGTDSLRRLGIESDKLNSAVEAAAVQVVGEAISDAIERGVLMAREAREADTMDLRRGGQEILEKLNRLVSKSDKE